MPPSTRVFWTIQLDDPMAAVADRTGAKAANLARAAGHDLPVLPGFVIPVQSADAEKPGRYLNTGELRRSWGTLSRCGKIPLVVRSSSTVEDGEVSSMAGRFVSVLDVNGWEAFVAAVGEVAASSSAPGTMAVLVQPRLEAVAGGVMFGADPVDGRTDRVIVSAVPGGPHTLVGGEVNGTRYALTRRGRVITVERDDDTAPGAGQGPLTRPQLRALARMAAKAAAVFGGPQDIEFAIGHDGRLWLLQSRPVTALAPVPPRRSVLLGPGPVAETLPDPLSPLEEDLWIVPLDHGLGEALATAGAVSRRALRRSPTVRTVGGRAAADLRRLGVAPGRRPRLRLLDPRPALRRLSVAWQVGRLRADLPALSAETVAAVDADLAAVPAPGEISEAELAGALRWSRATLAALHAQEALAGALLPPPDTAAGAGEGSAAAQGLAALRRGRAHGYDDQRLTAAEPAVLTLVPPSITPGPRLPAVIALPATSKHPPNEPRLIEPHPTQEPTNEQRPDEQRPDEQHASGQHANAQRAGAQRANEQRLNGQGAGRQGVTEQRPNEQHANGQPGGAQHPKEQHPDEQHASEQRRDDRHASAQRADTQHANEQRLNGQHANEQRPNGQHAGGQGGGGRGGTEARSLWSGSGAFGGELPPREALRLRIRWVQELGARLAWAAGRRLAATGALSSPERVRVLRFEELTSVLEGGALPADVERRPEPPPTAPLPAAFRLAGDRIVAEAAPGGDGARPAGGGRGSGTVHSGPGAPPPGSVLVVDTLRPSLAAHLPVLAGLIAETGSPLSHLAILARELGVPAVVGVRGAAGRFPAGTEVLVDGDTGRVEVLAEAPGLPSGEESVA
ncbi:PEP/pyruvate-binding domain-containing protein [Spirillospora sp. NPDC047279]|uniref:PEP/pyruvate-binding domain-containing protein n=1 Tax=Spirillospora sp. NPDC047279 TaxID=3155478 RepID=UPI003403E884